MNKQKLRISQCMIVKNEEKNIERALSWGKDIMWEQIVIDTGSTDRTVELAESMGAKIYHFEWIDDFAAAKNYAISKASGDWIAFLDADEYLTEEWVRKLPVLLEDLVGGPYYAVRSPWVCIDGDKITSVSRHCRFFRRMPGLRYQNAIHEQLAFEGAFLPSSHIIDVEGEFPVYHTGYVGDEIARKRKRNAEILKKELSKNPDSSPIMGYLGDTCFTEDNKSREAESWYRKAVKHMPEQLHIRDERSASTFINLLLCLLKQGREERELLEIYELACQKVPWVYDIDYLLGNYYYGKKEYEKTVLHLEKSLQVAETYGTSAYGKYMTGNIARLWEILAFCCVQTGRSQEAIRYCVTLLKADNQRFAALVLLISILKQEKPADALGFLQNLYNVDQMKDRIFLLRAVLRAKADGILELLREKCSEEELKYLDRLNQ